MIAKAAGAAEGLLPAAPRTVLNDRVLRLLVDDAPLREILDTLTSVLVEVGLADCTAALVAGDDGHMTVVSVTGAGLTAAAFTDDAASIATIASERRDLVSGATGRLMPRAAEAGFAGCWGVPLRSPGHQPVGCLVAVRTATGAPGPADESLLIDAARLATLAVQREVAGRAMRELVSTDPLTGLANRSVLVERIGIARTRQRHSGKAYAVVLLGIDGVSTINESLGHNAGDELLWLVAQRLQSVTTTGASVSRVWGDEFAVLIEDLDSAGDAAELAQRLRTAMAEPFDIDGIDLLATASFGVAVAAPQAADAPGVDVLRAASAALDQAKSAGRAQIGVYTGDRTAADLAPELRRSLAARELSVAYQPIVRLADSALVGWEALLRWTSRLHGSVSPTAFVPVAEESGLVSDLGRYALRTALQELATRRRAAGPDELSMAVNISAHELANESLPDTLAALLESYGVPAGALVLEVTENVLLRGGGLAWRVMDLLQKSGIRIAIDDFGTGFSQLSYLRQFRFDELKIDRSFVTDLPSDHATRAIVSNLIAMATDLGTPVVAEGIESAEQRRIVTDFGATYGQGFLFGAATE